jgi:cGMP-dependent protein kinase 1
MGSTCNGCLGSSKAQSESTVGIHPNEEMISESIKIPEKKPRKRKNKKQFVKINLNKVHEAPTAIISTRNKTETDVKMIESALRTHFLLKNIDEDGKKIIIEEMKQFTIGAKEIIFEQNNPAECFFVLVTGKLEVLVNNQRVNVINPGTGFGELALIDNFARSASVRTIERSVLWGLDGKSFKKSVESLNALNYTENRRFLDSIQIFKNLTDKQKELIMAAMTLQQWSTGEKIVKEGDTGDSLYIIKDGIVSCTQKGIELRQLTKGSSFGDQALLNHSVRTATVTAMTDLKVLSIGSNIISKVLGSNLQQILYRNNIRITFQKSPVFKNLTDEQLEKVIEKMKIITYQEGDTVITTGFGKGTHVWIVLKNKLKSSNKIIETFSCIGDEDFTNKKPSFFKQSYYADGECVVAEISKQEIEEILDVRFESIYKQNAMIPVLKKIQILRYLSKHKFQSVLKTFKVVKFAAGEVIFEQNSPGNKFYIISSGKVDIIKDKVVIRSINIHDYFGERSILFNEVRSATVVASSDAVCWVLDRKDFLNIVDENLRNQLISRIDLQDNTVTFMDLIPVKLIGKGMFGSVFLTTHRDKNTQYALKTVTRQKIAAYDIYDNIMLERKILMQLDHGMIIKLVKTFKDNLRIYFLMEYVQGMDLFDVLSSLGKLSHKNAAFYTGSLVMILENLHERDIIYRDLKPENIMVDHVGYLKLIDFGTAKFLKGKTYTTVGTPHYMAPDVIRGSGYTYAVDIWSLGVIVYEFFHGTLPFAENEEEPYKIYEKIIENKITFNALVEQNPVIKNFLLQLLNPDPVLRTRDNIKNNDFFRDLNWDKLASKELLTPYLPKLPSLANDLTRAKNFKRNLHDFISREESHENIGSFRAFKPSVSNWDEDF